MIWSRPITSTWPSWCAVLSIEHGSIRTYCRGRFAQSDPYETTECPVIGDCCKACVELVTAAAGGCTCRAGIVDCELHL